PGAARQGEPEGRPLPRPAPRVERAGVQPRVLQGDRQPQPGAAGGAGAGRVTAPEPVEDPPRLLRCHAGAVVTYEDGDRGLVDPDGDLDRSALTVLDRVHQEVAHDALDAARVDVGVARAAGPGDGDGRPGALGERGGELHGVGDDVLQVAPLDVEDRRAGVEPADL